MRVYLEGYGCSQNLGETAALGRAVVAAGHVEVRDPAQADVAVLVTCGVIGPTERRMVRRWRALGDRSSRLVVTGCLVPLRTGLFDGPAAARTTFLPIREQHRLPELLDGMGPGGATEPVAPAGPAPAPAPVASVVAEVTVAQGCTSGCSYCFSRLARGGLTSVPADRVVAEVEAAVRRGAVEVRLSSLDTSCWGVDLASGERLPDLLGRLGALPGSFRIRVGMMSPQSLAPVGERLLAAMQGERFYRFLHLPVQSGSDPVLAAMHRGYRAAEFRAWVDRARARLPSVTLATDVIVGFPGETERDFAATLGLVEDVAPEVLNVTRFSARPGTAASRLPPVPAAVAKRRSRALAELRTRTARARLERWLGRTEPGWVVEEGRHGSSVARLRSYLPVVLPDRRPLGSRWTIAIEGARATYLLGRALDGVSAEPPPASTSL